MDHAVCLWLLIRMFALVTAFVAALVAAFVAALMVVFMVVYACGSIVLAISSLHG